MKIKKRVTPAVMLANQTNCKKSAGPQTPEGKACSRFNALKHGLTARYLLATPEEAVANADLAAIIADLRTRYGGTTESEMLIDTISQDWWRFSRALQAEKRLYAEEDWPFAPHGSIPILERYVNSIRRALAKNLELLQCIAASGVCAEAEQLANEHETQEESVAVTDEHEQQEPGVAAEPLPAEPTEGDQQVITNSLSTACEDAEGPGSTEPAGPSTASVIPIDTAVVRDKETEDEGAA